MLLFLCSLSSQYPGELGFEKGQGEKRGTLNQTPLTHAAHTEFVYQFQEGIKPLHMI